MIDLNSLIYHLNKFFLMCSFTWGEEIHSQVHISLTLAGHAYQISNFLFFFFHFLGTWQCVKRKLPDSGRYDLESHLPVYLWKKYCDREEKDYFWELLGLLKKHQEVFFNENVSDTQESDLSSKVSCIYCGNTYKNEKGLKIHVKKCSEK